MSQYPCVRKFAKKAQKRRTYVLSALVVVLGGSWMFAAQVESPPATQRNYLTPVALEFSRDAQKLYIVCEDDDSVLALDVLTQRVLARTKVGHKPQGLAVSPDGGTLYVSNQWSDTVSEIDAATMQVRRTLSTGWGPIGIATDRSGKILYVANSIGDDVSVLDLTRGSEIKRLASSRSPHELLLSRDGRRVYVANLLPRLNPPDEPPVSELTAIDTQEQVVAERIPLPGVVELRHIAEAPDDAGGYLLVPFLRPKNLNPLIQVAQGWIVTHGMAVVPRSANAYGAAPQDQVRQVLLDDIDYYYAGASGVAFTPDGKHALVTSSEADVVSVIDTSRLQRRLQHIPAEELAERLDSAQEFVLRRLPTGSNPTAVAISADGRSAYIANRLDDSLTVIDMTEYRARSTIDLGGPKETSSLRRGERLFHNARYCFQGQFACATCHPDNHVDGLAWNLETPQLGHDRVLNRTLRGISGTAPYKWNGHNPDLETQCGPRIAKFLFHSEGFSREELADLVAYIKSIPLSPNRHLAPSGQLTPAQERGRRIFFEEACDTCHTPETHYTAKVSTDVGTATKYDTSGFFDIPQLDRVYERAPYLHSGQALTLEEIWTKYNPSGKHGITSGLTKEQLQDLVEFLKTL
ncbi:MAG TPA: c-type cytochrome [Terriglobales bacterium]|nr:c-type cytochrome [Terriglobales bacterium]